VKKNYKILSDQGQTFVQDRHGVSPELDEVTEVELSMAEEKALVAAGWLEGPIEPKGKKEEGK
jgi:hypothetical protein